MKAILALLILGGLVLGGVYFFGGYKGFDPNKQGAAARAAIKSGMTLKQVVDVAGSNPKYQGISTVSRKVGKETVEEELVGPPVDFNYDRIAQQVKSSQMPSGFILLYKFSEQTAFNVHFNGTGTVTHLSDAMTMGTLLNR